MFPLAVFLHLIAEAFEKVVKVCDLRRGFSVGWQKNNAYFLCFPFLEYMTKCETKCKILDNQAYMMLIKIITSKIFVGKIVL